MICEYETCSKVLTNKSTAFRGKHYCEEHGLIVAKGAAARATNPATQVPLPAPRAGVTCSRCSAEIEPRMDQRFAARAAGKPVIEAVLCITCYSLWVDASTIVIHAALQEFLRGEVDGSVEEIVPEIPEAEHMPEPDLPRLPGATPEE